MILLTKLYTIIGTIWVVSIIACNKSYQNEFDINISYQVSGTYNKQAAQGMAVYKDFAYLLNNTGLCRVYDLKQQKVIDTFPLASANNNNHSNCA